MRCLGTTASAGVEDRKTLALRKAAMKSRAAVDVSLESLKGIVAESKCNHGVPEMAWTLI